MVGLIPLRSKTPKEPSGSYQSLCFCWTLAEKSGKMCFTSFSSMPAAAAFAELVQQLAQFTADAKSGKALLPFCIQFHWAADQVETLYSDLLRQREISNFISRFEYDYE